MRLHFTKESDFVVCHVDFEGSDLNDLLTSLTTITGSGKTEEEAEEDWWEIFHREAEGGIRVINEIRDRYRNGYFDI